MPESMNHNCNSINVAIHKNKNLIYYTSKLNTNDLGQRCDLTLTLVPCTKMRKRKSNKLHKD